MDATEQKLIEAVKQADKEEFEAYGVLFEKHWNKLPITPEDEENYRRAESKFQVAQNALTEYRMQLHNIDRN